MTTIPDFMVATVIDHFPGPPPGQWTVADYDTLPDDGNRYELLAGVLYMVRPRPQRIKARVAGLSIYLTAPVHLPGIGQVFAAPIRVELAPQTIVEPDIVVVLHAHVHIVQAKRIVGAPDLVVEIVSPSTAGYDRREKQNDYAAAGMPEYWIADPFAHTIEVLLLEEGAYRSQNVLHGDSTLPSRVLPGFPVRVAQFFQP